MDIQAGTDEPRARDVATLPPPAAVYSETATDPPSAMNTATCKLPAGIDLPAIAYLMTGRPELSVPELMQIAEGQLPRQDASPFGLHATQLVLQSMLVYKHVLTTNLHALLTLGYSTDTMGWTSLHQCAACL